MEKTRIVYMGTPEFAVGPLDAIIKNGHEVCAVVTVPDKASGRGLKTTESEVKKYAVSAGLKVLQPVSLKDESFLKELEQLHADLFVVVAFRMLPEVVWSMPRLGTFNLHTSLLPQYRGAAPINWAIINGEKESGVTTFMIDKDIDTGAIILQEKCSIKDSDNFGTLHDKLMDMGSSLVIKSIDCILKGDVTLKVQSSGTELKPAPKITKETCRIDWKKETKEIINLIRGLSPYPAAYSEMRRGENDITTAKIYEAENASGRMPDNRKPGEISRPDKNTLLVKTSDGAVSIKSIQLAGKKRLDIKDFLAGSRDIENQHFI